MRFVEVFLFTIKGVRIYSISIRAVPSLPNLTYRIVQGDSLLERLFGHSVQLDKMTKDQRTAQIIDSIGADKLAYFHETDTQEKRLLELKILSKQVELAERLVEAKKASLTSHNLSLFGESRADARLRELRERQEAQLTELSDRIKRAETELKKLMANRAKTLDRGGFEQLRRHLFQVQGAPTFIWHMDFAEVFRDRGGFDVVIGNPPYYNVETLGKASEVVQALQLHYPEIWMDKSDILFYFICLGTRIQHQHGTLVFITSRSYIEANKAENLREYLAKRTTLLALMDFRGFRVFEEAGIATSILIDRASRQEKAEQLDSRFQVLQVGQWDKGKDALAEALQLSLCSSKDTSDRSLRSFSVERRGLGRTPWNFTAPAIQKVFDKLDASGPSLNKVVKDIGRGMQSGRNRIFGVSAETVETYALEEKHLRLYAANSDVDSFVIRNRGRYLIYLEEVASFSAVPTGIARYLKEHERELKKRAAFERGNCRWWQYTWPLHKEYYGAVHRIICPYRSGVNRFAFDERDEFISLDDTTVVFVERDSAVSVYTVEALLNSTLLTFRYRGIGKLTAQNSWEYFDYGLARLPIKLPESGHEKSLCTRLHKLAMVAHGNRRERSELMSEIDEAVYEYYDITPDERKAIESELEWSSFAAVEAEAATETSVEL